MNVEEIAVHDYGPDNRILAVKVRFEKNSAVQSVDNLRIDTQTLLAGINGYKLMIIPLI
jgi:hypothetical protein